MNLYNSCLHDLPSINAVFITFPKFRMKRSTSPFAFGHNGVIRWCLNPTCFVREGVELELVTVERGPLSVLSFSGIPRTENTLSNAGMTLLALVGYSDRIS